jgi:hypothetical protein
MNKHTISSLLCRGMHCMASAWLACMLLPGQALAHKPSDAYLQLDASGSQIAQRLDIALRDLDRDLMLDRNEDGQLDWGEVRQRWSDLDSLALQTVSLRADDRACSAGPAGPAQLEAHSDGRYAVLTRRWTCPAPVRNVAIGYTLFAQTDPTHRGIVRIQQDGHARSAVLTPGKQPQVFALASGHGETPWSTMAGSFGSFVREGVHHILIGTDHVLFLLALLLPAVLVRVPSRAAATGAAEPALPWPPLQTGVGAAALPARFAAAVPQEPGAMSYTAGWQPARAWKPALLDVLRIVTAFTVAHSITLALAMLGVVDPPSRWVESIIAGSVALAALNNLHPVMGAGRWKLTFVFGLIHGFGFAGVMKDLGLAEGALAMPLLGFNLGVELGQLAIVTLFMAIAWPVRHTRFYHQVVLGAGSVAIGLLAVAWLVERAFDITLPWPV